MGPQHLIVVEFVPLILQAVRVGTIDRLQLVFSNPGDVMTSISGCAFMSDNRLK